MMAAVTLSVLVAMGGAVLLVFTLVPPTQREGEPARYRKQKRGWSLSRPTQLRLLIGVGVGVLLTLITQWVVLIVAIPLAVIGLPLLLKDDNQKVIDKLDGLEAWTRSLAGLTTAGQGLERTLIASRDSCPAPIKDEVTRLVARLNSRMTTENALRMFADELDDETADLVVAHLLLKTNQRGSGLANALQDLAESILSEVRARRQIETERSGPRNETRIVVFVTLGVVGLLLVAQSYSAPYGTPLGQVLLAAYLAIDVLLLLMMRRMTRAIPGPRILVRTRKGA
ncbi:type II secretion system F family protein [Microbacterium gubbeenense]|uniref:type II secretion system F family protein n=1 Tax=Microbacterium gubbeenense TaxID=159896 RepID=UPI00055E3C6F|nr:type II secretion system F family protein [Microbacterium gubbeenense]